MHSSKKITGSKGDSLEGKFIILALTGSVAVVKSFDLCRELMRKGARVKIVMSEAATKLISKEMMHYASGEEVITELSGAIEHVQYFGIGGEADLLLVAPATANTISKISLGIDDTAVTTFATTAIGGRKPVLVVPAMHFSMHEHPIVKENMYKLEATGVRVIEPRIEEGKAKIAEIDEIVIEVERELGGGKLRGKKILISAGAMQEEIDPIRVLTNRASGRTGAELAKEAYRLGAEKVCLLHNGEFVPLVENVKVETNEKMERAVFSELKKGCSIFISTAAMSDFSVEREERKIKSGKEINLKLIPREKLLEKVRGKFPKLFIVGFKAETFVEDGKLEKGCREFLRERKLDLVVGNDVGRNEMGGTENEVLVVSGENTEKISGKKELVAKGIFELIR